MNEAGVIPGLQRWDCSAPAHHGTRVATAWDDEGLLVVFTCRDLDAWATLLEHDAPLWREEVVEVFLAPGSEPPRSYVELELNPRGALFDALIHNPHSRREDMVTELGWACAGSRTRVDRPESARAGSEDWRAAFFLPWAGLGVAAPPPVWRANFYRIERPRRPEAGPEEFAAWSPTRTPQPDFHQPARFGRLELAGHARRAPTGIDTPDVPTLQVPHLGGTRPIAAEVANFCQFLGKRL